MKTKTNALADAEFLNTAQLADAMKCSERQIHRLLKTGLIPAPVRIGAGRGRYRWPASDLAGNLLMTPDEVASTLGVSKRTVWRWLQLGRFPEPVRLSSKMVRWQRAAVAAWIDALPLARSATA